MKQVFLRFAFLFLWSLAGAQEKGGEIQGKVVDKETGEPVAGAMVTLVGTYYGAISRPDGTFVISSVKPGEYTLKVTMMGYNEWLMTGVKVKEGQKITLTVALTPKGTTLKEVEIIGDKPYIDLESGMSELILRANDLEGFGVTNIQSIATMQVGVTQTPDGIQIRGGRVYETQYVVEGVNAQDPLAGTGFGVEVNKAAVDEVAIVTGTSSTEYGDGTAGVIVTKIKEGTNQFHLSANYQRDNIGYKLNQGMNWNAEILNVTVSGPLLGKWLNWNEKKPRWKYFFAGNMDINDTYFRVIANQLHSSLLKDDAFIRVLRRITGNDALTKDRLFAPRQDNKWQGTLKLTYDLTQNARLDLTIQQSLMINQNTRSLQIIGNDQIMTPGLQYAFALQPDNANTYTHRSNLTVLHFKHVGKRHWTMDWYVGRLFTNLRVDANGRPFRDSTVTQVYDPYSIVTDPITLYNPYDSVVYVNPGPGLYNNGGIATLWHDHYVEEYTLKGKFHYMPRKPIHFLTFGFEHREAEYQWIDVQRPWIGAPIPLPDGQVYSSNRIGQSSDIWKARPAFGGIFFEDKIQYEGIIANLGLRFNYWAYGTFVDQAVENPKAPVLDVLREEYRKQTIPIGGRRFQGRLLPKLRVSFPVTENNVLYFNYGHSLRMPHPRFIYAGLDPVYQNQSYLANLGNPNLKPEATVSYEVGIKTQISSSFAITVAGFYNDKYDYIVMRSVTIRDATGRFVTKTMAINQDYARIRGLEVSLFKKWKYVELRTNGAYQVATGKSNSARESLLQIQQTGRVQATREFYLAWDRPFEWKGFVTIRTDSTWRIGPISFPNFVITIASTWKSGLRYTPYVFTGVDEFTGRPIYEPDETRPFARVGSPWSWTDVRIQRDFRIRKRIALSLYLFVENIFDQRNAQIVNPVTGRAYEYGDPVPFSWRDPLYPNPLDRGLPPDNPSRYLQPRHFWWGFQFQL